MLIRHIRGFQRSAIDGVCVRGAKRALGGSLVFEFGTGSFVAFRRFLRELFTKTEGEIHPTPPPRTSADDNDQKHKLSKV